MTTSINYYEEFNPETKEIKQYSPLQYVQRCYSGFKKGTVLKYIDGDIYYEIIIGQKNNKFLEHFEWQGMLN